MRKLLLVLGRDGQVARELAKLGALDGLELAFSGRERLDLARADPCSLLDELRPTAVINAAGYTAVDKAESDPEAAFRLNRDVPAALALACAASGLPLVHFSTDYVFDGAKPTPYVESDAVAPAGIYGASKAEGEAKVMAAGGPAIVLRTSWVFSAFGANFVKTMLRLAESRDEIAVVADQIGRPTWAADCARAAVRSVQAMLAGEVKGAELYHLAGQGDASWADFAEAIFAISESRGGPSARVRRIGTVDYPTPAKRPTNSRLDCTKIARELSFRAGPWQEGLRTCWSN